MLGLWVWGKKMGLPWIRGGEDGDRCVDLIVRMAGVIGRWMKGRIG